MTDYSSTEGIYIEYMPLSELVRAPRNPKDRVCTNCGQDFQAPWPGRPDRFCSKKCWYEWHRGENHQQYTKQEVECDWCGEPFHRNPYELAKSKRHYCCQKCSAQARSAYLGGDGESSYYALANWRKIRKQVIARDCGCVVCGMIEEEHIALYGTSLHVDHIVPRKQGGTDDLENLQTMCCKDHFSKTYKGL